MFWLLPDRKLIDLILDPTPFPEVLTLEARGDPTPTSQVMPTEGGDLTEFIGGRVGAGPHLPNPEPASQHGSWPRAPACLALRPRGPASHPHPPPRGTALPLDSTQSSLCLSTPPQAPRCCSSPGPVQPQPRDPPPRAVPLGFYRQRRLHSKSTSESPGAGTRVQAPWAEGLQPLPPTHSRHLAGSPHTEPQPWGNGRST